MAIDLKQPEILYAGIGWPRALAFGKGPVYKTVDGRASFRRGVRGLDHGLHQGPLAMVFDPLDPQHC